MARLLYALLGAIVALVPGTVQSVYEALAFEDTDECTPKEWLGTAVRAEGLALLIASLLGGKPYAGLVGISGVTGLLAFLFPKQYLQFGAAVAYEGSEAIEVHDRFVPVARVLGGLSVLLAVREYRGAQSEAARRRVRAPRPQGRPREEARTA